MLKMIDEAIDTLSFVKNKYVNVSKSILGIFNPNSGKELGESFADILNNMDDIYGKFVKNKEDKE